MRVVANLFHLRRRINSSAPHVHRILQADQRRLRVVINFRSDARLHLLPRQNPIFAPHRSRHATRNRGHRRQLVQIHMAPLFADHFVAVMRPHFDRDEIPHASRRHKQRRFFPKNLRRPPLQPVDRRVFSVHVVADLGFRHRPPHLRRRTRHRIAPQIHHLRRNLAHLRQLIRIHSLIPLRHRITHIRFSPCCLCSLCSAFCALCVNSFLYPVFLCALVSALSFSASVLFPSLPNYFLASLFHQFHKHFVGHRKPVTRQPHHPAIPLHQPRPRQRIKSPRQSHTILPLNPPQVDSIQLPQSQKQFLLERTLGRQPLPLLHRQPSALHRAHVRRRVMRIRPSLRPRKRMRPRPKSQIRLPPPILQIVLRFESRLRPI